MGMFSKLSRVFGGGAPNADGRSDSRPGADRLSPTPATPSSPSTPPRAESRFSPTSSSGERTESVALAGEAPRPGLEPLQVDEPIEVELSDDGDPNDTAADRLHNRLGERGEDRGLPEIKAPKNKQEMIQELQKNYSELVGLIRKVDGHLDEQDVRSRRLMEIAERLPAALDVLPDLRTQNAKLAESMGELVEVTRQAHASGDARHDAQQQALGKVSEHLARSSDFEQRLGDSLETFGSTLGDVNSSTSELGEVLETMRARDEKRDAELAKALDSGQRTMMTVLVMCGVSVALVVVLALMAMFG